MKAIRTFVIVASDTTARFLENTGVGQGLREVEALDAAENVGYSDMPGRSQASGGTARHGFARPSDEEEHARNAFAKEVLQKAAARHGKVGFDRLVLCAPPKMLGALRAHLDGPLAAALTADLNKDLTKIDLADLPSHFSDIAAF